ncbi:HAD family hydrolase [Mycolicibacterium arenosum]|uniref:HAD family hydrolase n=1 Tax=Mycolicibacterium arenosum TaxID=2952157 RepID=A0ABT1M7A8_9MYCO|nr:HAD family hydrolase [Mycolicibacterium sp. CAU 1645]MCP9274109.1 HAD family hydrolase [Mycolicibacterium sp. CAU 1645]
MRATTALLASDLDRTLIYSRRFVTDPATAVCVEIYRGEPISFMTPGAVERLTALAATHHVIPATTRTVEQFTRITLPGAPFRYAVTSNGGTILCDGVADRAWTAAVFQRINDTSTPLTDVVAALRARVSDAWVRNFRIAEDLFCYLVVDEELLPADFLEAWREWCAPRGWIVSRQGRKIYSVPISLCKSHAVAEVRRRLVDAGALDASAPLLAAGDGALDAELLESADAAMRPSHGELHAQGWTIPTLTVTDTAGAAAAKAILDWFAHSVAEKPAREQRALQ